MPYKRTVPGRAASLIPNTQSSIPNPGLKHSASLTSQPPASPSLFLLPIRIKVEMNIGRNSELWLGKVFACFGNLGS